ncbi:MAG: hypothetical protein ACLQGP_18085 [Isosphaeraceae bacterium]
MARTKLTTAFVPFGLVCLTCMFSAECARAQFPGQNTDSTTSLGKFTIDVNPTLAPTIATAFNNGDFPGYTLNQPTSGPQAGQTFLTSPLLYDPTTTIARSDNTTVGSNATLNLGNPLYTTASASSAATPPSGWNPAAGTNEVYTALQSLNLTSGGTSVTAGEAIPAGTPNSGVVSYGQVASQSSMAGASFPANSFFDVFVNVTVSSSLGSIGLYNTSPLIVESSGLTSFPPTVLYTHQQSSGPAPNLYINVPSDSPFYSFNGDSFGTIIVSGHGAGYNDGGASGTTGPGPAQFNQQYNQLLQTAGVTPEPSTWIMLLTAGLIVPAYARWSRLGLSTAK